MPELVWEVGNGELQRRVERARRFDMVREGRLVAAGVAWDLDTGIDRVVLLVDGGPWQQARMSTEVNADTWRMWLIELDLLPGGHTVECGANDR